MELKDFIPGYFQGITRVIISYPFDYVRLFLQTNNIRSYKDFFNKHSLFSFHPGNILKKMYCNCFIHFFLSN